LGRGKWRTSWSIPIVRGPIGDGHALRIIILEWDRARVGQSGLIVEFVSWKWAVWSAAILARATEYSFAMLAVSTMHGVASGLELAAKLGAFRTGSGSFQEPLGVVQGVDDFFWHELSSCRQSGSIWYR
jgi:hypothetical protein